jgi:hypothetical protein
LVLALDGVLLAGPPDNFWNTGLLFNDSTSDSCVFSFPETSALRGAFGAGGFLDTYTAPAVNKIVLARANAAAPFRLFGFSLVWRYVETSACERESASWRVGLSLTLQSSIRASSDL